VSVEDVKTFNDDQRSRTAQVEEGLYLHSPNMDEPPDYINHSCDPNVGFNGQIVLVAMRQIEVGEEVCFDYAMCDSTPYDEFPCGCGSAKCRGKVSGDDWQRPELQQRYAGYFMPYLQKKLKTKDG
jgi:SET domain-containing protein